MSSQFSRISAKFSRYNFFEQGATMNADPAKSQPFPGQGAVVWIDAYKQEMLEAKDEATIEAYTLSWRSLPSGSSSALAILASFTPRRSRAPRLSFFSIRCPVSATKSRPAPLCPGSAAGYWKIISASCAPLCEGSPFQRRHSLPRASCPQTSATWFATWWSERPICVARPFSRSVIGQAAA